MDRIQMDEATSRWGYYESPGGDLMSADIQPPRYGGVTEKHRKAIQIHKDAK